MGRQNLKPNNDGDPVSTITHEQDSSFVQQMSLYEKDLKGLYHRKRRRVPYHGRQDAELVPTVQKVDAPYTSSRTSQPHTSTNQALRSLLYTSGSGYGSVPYTPHGSQTKQDYLLKSPRANLPHTCMLPVLGNSRGSYIPTRNGYLNPSHLSPRAKLRQALRKRPVVGGQITDKWDPLSSVRHLMKPKPTDPHERSESSVKFGSKENPNTPASSILGFKEDAISVSSRTDVPEANNVTAQSKPSDATEVGFSSPEIRTDDAKSRNTETSQGSLSEESHTDHALHTDQTSAFLGSSSLDKISDQLDSNELAKPKRQLVVEMPNIVLLPASPVPGFSLSRDQVSSRAESPEQEPQQESLSQTLHQSLERERELQDLLDDVKELNQAMDDLEQQGTPR